ncbi:glycosyltransferase [Pilimelia columellifera]|uniref:Glycosyltransferase n=1 Tax=Pilimelia columellifera subsp. columellifera TaxID=706583 RepID=A0ABN3NDZ2_9ACTN
MIDIVLVAAVVPTRRGVLEQTLRRFQSGGARVLLACLFDPAELDLPASLAQARWLVGPEDDPSFDRRVRRAEPGRQMWIFAERDGVFRRRGARADVLVALDPRAIHTVWQLAQRNRHADAVYGLTPAANAVQARLANPAHFATRRMLLSMPSPTLAARGVLRSATDRGRGLARRLAGKRIMRTRIGRGIWRTVVTAPGLSDTRRIGLANRVYDSMLRAEQVEAATATAVAVARKVRDTRRRAQLTSRATAAELAQGRVPEHLASVVGSQLSLADECLRRGDAQGAGAAVSTASALLFHRGIHFDVLSSPLVDDPAGFLAPIYHSEVGRALAGCRGRARAAKPPTGRRQRILFITRLNDNFLGEIRARYATHPDCETRYLDLDSDPNTQPLTRRDSAMISHILAGDSAYGHEVTEWLKPHLEWADTIFIDWCAASAALVTLIDPGPTRVIVRLHSYETFTLWPHMVDFSRVDDIIFVSEHLRDLTLRAVPALVGPTAPRARVISNAMELTKLPRPKDAQARFVLGLVGISAVAKDPRWAIEVLRLLRRRDDRYRLVLLGSDINPRASGAAARYLRELEREIGELTPAGAVERWGHVEDVPSALTGIGVILSSSVRESFHCALVEGAASAALPVARDWPFFAGRDHSARTLFPADWVVSTPAEATERIIANTADEAVWREQGAAASRHALTTWDWNVVARDYDRLFFGG